METLQESEKHEEYEWETTNGWSCKTHGTEQEVKIYIINNLRESRKTIKNTKQENTVRQYDFWYKNIFLG